MGSSFPACCSNDDLASADQALPEVQAVQVLDETSFKSKTYEQACKSSVAPGVKHEELLDLPKEECDVPPLADEFATIHQEDALGVAESRELGAIHDGKTADLVPLHSDTGDTQAAESPMVENRTALDSENERQVSLDTACSNPTSQRRNSADGASCPSLGRATSCQSLSRGTSRASIADCKKASNQKKSKPKKGEDVRRKKAKREEDAKEKTSESKRSSVLPKVSENAEISKSLEDERRQAEKKRQQKKAKILRPLLANAGKAFHELIDDGNAEMIRDMIEFGASPDEPDDSGLVPLKAACGSDQVECVKVLLEMKANVNLVGRGITGHISTALHIACKNGCEANIRALLNAGADPSVRNGRDQLPIDTAQMFNQPSAVKIVKMHLEKKTKALLK